jgi:nuclear GTP-binding protein
VSLDRNLKLLDSPGVVFSSADQNSLLRNCIPVDALSDPVEPVNSILGHCDRRLLQELYKISAFQDSHEFLIHVASRRGLLKKGGIHDVEAAARVVLRDWNSGLIPFYTEPPSEPLESTRIVPDYSKAFDLGGLLSLEEDQFLSLLASKSANFVSLLPKVVSSESATNYAEQEINSAIALNTRFSMNPEHKEQKSTFAAHKRLTGHMSSSFENITVADLEERMLNPQYKKIERSLVKSARKDAKRKMRLEGLCSMNDSKGDLYDFKTDFAQLEDELVV